MAATSALHIVRITVRISAGAVHRDIDVSLPTASTLAEVLPELSQFIDLPEIDRPWSATTAAGTPLDMFVPLHKLKLFDASVVTFHPAEAPTPPVVRDAAESLTAAAAGAREVKGLDSATSLVGVACAGLLVSRVATAPLAWVVSAILALAVAVSARSRSVFLLVPAAAAVAAGLWVAGPRSEWLSAADPALGVISASLVAGVGAAAGAIAGLAGPATATLYLTCAALAACGAAGAWFPAGSAPSAIVVLLGLFTVMATPAVATRLAGLKIPRIPTAGEEFGNADGYQADVDKRSTTAITIASAMTAGVATCAIPALCALAATHSGGWAFALCLSTAGTLALHALRQHYPAPRIALTATTLAAVTACAWMGAEAAAHPAIAVVAALAAALACTAPLWQPHLPKLEPTTVVWFERAETAAIIAAVPLAVHLTGVFTSIRGL